MKKKLEADLISIAHRILKLKNKSDINQLYLETQKLYEKLAVLKFVEENFDGVKPTIGQHGINAELETIFDKQEVLTAEIEIETPVTEEVIALEESHETENTEEAIIEIAAETPVEVIPEPLSETISEPIAETEEPIIAETIEEPALEIKEESEKETEIAEELSFRTFSDLKPIPESKPAFELEAAEEPEKVEEPKIETSSKPQPVQILFEDLGINYGDAQFVKVDSFEAVTPTPSSSINEFKENKESVETVIAEATKPKTVPLNEKLAKGFHIDLNDRIAFTKNLFGNNTEDYSRVLNQLLTFDNYEEAQEFIENMVKPDYNNWEGKDDYAQRFLEIVEKKFS